MGKAALRIKIHIDGLKETIQAFDRLPHDAIEELKDASDALSRILAAKARADGMADTAPQSSAVATTVAIISGRVPGIQAGGPAPLGRNRKPAYKLLFGSIFGSDKYRQFHRPHRGTYAYWFFPVVEAEVLTIGRKYNEAADHIIANFSRGGRRG